MSHAAPQITKDQGKGVEYGNVLSTCVQKEERSWPPAMLPIPNQPAGLTMFPKQRVP